MTKYGSESVLSVKTLSKGGTKKEETLRWSGPLSWEK